ncbi:Tas retrotransposon peptidase A16 [Ancylostoma duodenale]|uniref:Tas retrotransposon peptidase A16 n=1 Tax=Ancylostoma duodenale TaxID=51022 RepID=A0A0C2GPJ3_9BILA|nr:Tas retrotransposon peptidase A16 [Ancylostoma duodenale]
MFTMNVLFQLLEEIISNEEMVTLYTGGSDRSSLPTSTRFDNKSRQVSTSVPSCMYCEGKHKSFACDKYRTPQERSQYLRDHKLCLICASPQHITSECQRRPCFKCQKRHHTSCCFQSGSKEWNPTPKKEFDHKKKVKGTSNGGKEPKLFKSSVKVNQLGHDEQDTASPEEKNILEVRSEKRPQRRQGTFLPTGELTVMNPATKELRKVDVLLDTGAEISFIDTTLAQELQLPTLKEARLRLHTFGSDKVQEKHSRKVPLEVWDAEGRPLSLVLFTHDILTKPFVTSPVCEEDLAFLRRKNLPINFSSNKSTVKPSILLGSVVDVITTKRTTPATSFRITSATYTTRIPDYGTSEHVSSHRDPRG